MKGISMSTLQMASRNESFIYYPLIPDSNQRLYSNSCYAVSELLSELLISLDAQLLGEIYGRRFRILPSLEH